MRPYFTRERFRRPQFLAGLLLLCFLGQTVWLVQRELKDSDNPKAAEAVRIGEGWKQWHGKGIAGAPFRDGASDSAQGELGQSSEVKRFDTEQSPLLYLVAAAPMLAWPRDFDGDSALYWQWLPRLPFLACGVLLGASLWYVARRLCGNTGGFIALTFYCFSPSLIQASAVWHTEPEIVAVWGAFGTVFTAIAVAHTLYAPREVVLWNWRRILLLGVSLAIAVGSQFSLIVLAPMALGFLLYVAPIRMRAGVVIWIAACAAGFTLLFGVYFFHPHAFARSMQHAAFLAATWRGFTVPGVYKEVAARIGRGCPALALVLPVATITYAAWPRTRYFGNTAPLLVAVLFLALGMAHPDVAGAGFLLAAIPFLFIFVAGVLADLMETRHRALVTACTLGMMLAYVAWSLLNLAQVPRG
ncbi:MAG TPA: hypothetical protein VMD99_13080 [Terriglobales bacterium]|nr:hypothetical protein [Terriglobales bacterium]